MATRREVVMLCSLMATPVRRETKAASSRRWRISIAMARLGDVITALQDHRTETAALPRQISYWDSIRLIFAFRSTIVLRWQPPIMMSVIRWSLSGSSTIIQLILPFATLKTVLIAPLETSQTLVSTLLSSDG